MGKQTNYSPTFPQYPAGAFAITPNDNVNLQNVAVVYVGATGNLKVTTANGDIVTFNGLLAGTVVPVQVLRVWSTGSTASMSLIGIY
jgi:type IV secretory pathway TrbD component